MSGSAPVLVYVLVYEAELAPYAEPAPVPVLAPAYTPAGHLGECPVLTGGGGAEVEGCDNTRTNKQKHLILLPVSGH